MNKHNHHWELTPYDLQLIDLAFIEDLGLPYQDLTTSTLFAEAQTTQRIAKIISKENKPIIVSGLRLVQPLLHKIDSTCHFTSRFQDGDQLAFGEILLNLSGAASSLLQIERTLLNFLQRLCAIATLTNQYVEKIKHTKTKILDTRKTIPGLRRLEKYAVLCGGGVNHRMGLYDAIMIKDTHVDFIGGMKKAVAKLPDDILKTCPVIVEVRDLNELDIVLQEASQKVSRVLLDNMSSDLLIKSVARCQNKMMTEASGNINLNNIVEIAECGVDFISIGKITHSAGNVDLSMQCDN